MELIPNEIIELILQDPNLTIKDVVNFSSTCSKFRDVVNDSSVIWKFKYFQRWPKNDFSPTLEDWMKEYISRVHFEKHVLQMLSEMSAKFYSVNIIADNELEFVNELVNSHSCGYFYIVDYLLKLNYSESYEALTVRYYSDIVLRFIKRRHLKKVWENLKNTDPVCHVLEKGAIFVANWFQIKEESIERIVDALLNEIANGVKAYVKQEYKDNPLNMIPEETLLQWQEQNIPGNMFEPIHSKQILSCIRHIMFHQMQYRFKTDVTYCETRFGIDFAVVYKETSPLILAVIYESVARRVGVKCEIAHFPAHTLLRWREDYSNRQSPYCYIDLSGRGTFLKPGCCTNLMVGRCPESRQFPCLDMQGVAENSTKEIYVASRTNYNTSNRNLLELIHVLKPHDLECYRQLGSLYMCREMDIRGLIDKLVASAPFIYDVVLYEPLLSSFRVYAENWEQNRAYKNQAVKRRTEDIEFAVGMIGLHKLYDYKCVVYGWDSICNASPEWIHEMGVQNLMKKDQQPFYNVLAQDGSVRYVAQENLIVLHTPPLFCHPEIGRYFEEYCITHYKANKELEACYPEDGPALQKILEKHREPNI